MKEISDKGEKERMGKRKKKRERKKDNPVILNVFKA